MPIICVPSIFIEVTDYTVWALGGQPSCAMPVSFRNSVRRLFPFPASTFSYGIGRRIIRSNAFSCVFRRDFRCNGFRRPFHSPATFISSYGNSGRVIRSNAFRRRFRSESLVPALFAWIFDGRLRSGDCHGSLLRRIIHSDLCKQGQQVPTSARHEIDERSVQFHFA